MGVVQYGARCLVPLQHEGLGLEAFPNHRRRRVSEVGVPRGGLAHAGLHLPARLGERHRRQHPRPHVEGAPGGHRARPVPALDLAHVEVRGMVMAVEVRIVHLAGVPVLLELAQGLDQPVGRLDGVRARIRLVHVHRMASHLHLEPHHPDLRGGEGVGARLRDQCGLRPVATLQAGERPVARAFLLYYRLLEQVRRRLVTEAAQGQQRVVVQHQPGLHVARAAAEQPAVTHLGRERRPLPHGVRAFGHHVDVAVQDQ